MEKFKNKRFLALIMATMLLITALPVSAATSTISDVEKKLEGVNNQRGSMVYDKEGDGNYDGKSDVFIEGKSINNLKGAVEALKNVVVGVQTTVSNHETRIAALEKTVNSLQSTVNNIQNVTIKNIVERIEALENKEPEIVETKYSFNILYGFDAGVTDTVSGMYSKGEKITLPTIPNRGTDYEALGWEVSGMGIKKEKAQITMPERDVVASIVWNYIDKTPTPYPYKLQYYSLNTSTGKYQQYGLPKDCTSNTAVTLLEVPDRASTTSTYSITLDKNDGTGATDTTSAKIKKTITWKKDGWNDNEYCDGNTYPGGSSSLFDPGEGNTKNLYASYSSNPAECVIEGLPDTLERDGYVFQGWNTQADGNGTFYFDGIPVASGTTTLTLYAYWIQVGEADSNYYFGMIRTKTKGHSLDWVMYISPSRPATAAWDSTYGTTSSLVEDVMAEVENALPAGSVVYAPHNECTSTNYSSRYTLDEPVEVDFDGYKCAWVNRNESSTGGYRGAFIFPNGFALTHIFSDQFRNGTCVPLDKEAIRKNGRRTIKLAPGKEPASGKSYKYDYDARTCYALTTYQYSGAKCYYKMIYAWPERKIGSINMINSSLSQVGSSEAKATNFAATFLYIDPAKVSCDKLLWNASESARQVWSLEDDDAQAKLLSAFLCKANSNDGGLCLEGLAEGTSANEFAGTVTIVDHDPKLQ